LFVPTRFIYTKEQTYVSGQQMFFDLLSSNLWSYNSTYIATQEILNYDDEQI